MSGHTKGPWEISNLGIWGVSPWNARVLLGTVVSSSPMNGIDAQANGCLMASAPELLEALDWLLASVEANPADERYPGDREERLQLACAAARAAIAKATPLPTSRGE